MAKSSRTSLRQSKAARAFPYALVLIVLLAPRQAQGVIVRQTGQCGGLGGGCMQAGGQGGPCQDTAWPGYACAAGNACMRESSYWWACTAVPATSLPSSCAAALQSAAPGTTTQWIDGDTPNSECSVPICRESFANCNVADQPTENMVLVFSDEFQDASRTFAGCDFKWTAMDLDYSVNGDVAAYKPDAVTVQNGSAVITVSRQSTSSPASAPFGEAMMTQPYRSGMMQGWDKFCFTGGYVEARVMLPGGTNYTGLWPAFFLMGNAGRAGYINSTTGLWPFSYDTCDQAARGNQSWSQLPGQKYSRCSGSTGRGVPEIDVFEVGIWEQGYPLSSTSAQVAPILPPDTDWLDFPGGMFFPTSTAASNSTFNSRPNSWAGVNSYPGHPRPGTSLQDAISAIHNLDDSYFDSFHTYGVDWLPGQYLRWYIDGVMVFEANSIAFQGATNAAGQSCGDRLVSMEPSYMVLDVTMSNEYTTVDPNIPLPAEMQIDYVRVYQSASSINIGCDPPGYTTSDIIAANRAAYFLHTVPDPFYPTASCPASKGPNLLIVAIAVPVVVAALALIGVGSWFGLKWYRKQLSAKINPSGDVEATGAAAGAKPAGAIKAVDLGAYLGKSELSVKPFDLDSAMPSPANSPELKDKLQARARELDEQRQARELAALQRRVAEQAAAEEAGRQQWQRSHDSWLRGQEAQEQEMVQEEHDNYAALEQQQPHPHPGQAAAAPTPQRLPPAPKALRLSMQQRASVRERASASMHGQAAQNALLTELHAEAAMAAPRRPPEPALDLPVEDL